jgi:hypothetical protein
MTLYCRKHASHSKTNAAVIGFQLDSWYQLPCQIIDPKAWLSTS